MRATVRVPATSANLGPGFDALGLALALYDEVEAQVVDGPTTVAVFGEGADELPTDEQHLVVRSMHATFEALGVAPLPVALTCRNAIPQARGLGSSSAAIVAGVLLARQLAAARGDEFDDDAVLRLATELEGHPDNVAPCLHGGFTVAWASQEHVRVAKLTPASSVRPTVFIPSHQGLTAQARAALPAWVSHADAAHSAGRAALLVHALTQAPQLLFDATEDRLHQCYRASAMPESADLLASLRAIGVAAVLSGAGPSVLALSPVPLGSTLPPAMSATADMDVAAIGQSAGAMARYDLMVDLTGAAVSTR